MNGGLKDYNGFCSNLREGYILYNLDSENGWGEYLLVGEKFTVCIGEQKTFAALLFGLKKKEKRFVFNGIRVKLTPECAGNVPFLKYVGKCRCLTFPDMDDFNVNMGLAVAYSTTDLHKYSKMLSIRKPKKSRYGSDGKPYERGC